MEIQKLKKEILDKIKEVKNLVDLEQLRIEIMGRKGIIAKEMQKMKDLSQAERPIFGKMINEIKDIFEKSLNEKIEFLQNQQLLEKISQEEIDITLPGVSPTLGGYHPLSIVNDDLNKLFISLGYQVATGKEVELDLYNFERANIPFDHPAREMQDTFFIDVERLLRTHTTAIQVRELELNAHRLPIKIICPGKTYRRDADDATHSHQFSQTEGLVVGENITFSDLKGTLELLAKHFFGQKREIRLRPSYFQFTEPSVEVDVSCFKCQGKGCEICKKSGWIEILGAGMVHPKVLEMAGIDSNKYTGFAFGVGIERLTMLKYGVDDIRSFYLNDLRMLESFKGIK